jgi:S-adenosylmethionine-diacylgycerolhomoserine-N-methlytransferase
MLTGPALSDQLAGYYRWHSLAYDWTRWAFLFGRSELVNLLAGQLRPKRILEVGCGTGANLVRLAQAFPEAEIVGLDLSVDMLNVARRKTAPYAPRVSLAQGAYRAPLNAGVPFDCIVFSYCLTMINPGFEQVLAICRQDLHPQGIVAIVDFHDTRFAWFRRWMGLNHVRMDRQILTELQTSAMHLPQLSIRAAYGGWWRWLICCAKIADQKISDQP